MERGERCWWGVEGRFLYIHVERNSNVRMIDGVRPGTEGRGMHGNMIEEIMWGG